MAIIQTIRDKYAKVAGALIILALVGFVLTDLGKSGFSNATTVAKVDGEKIDVQDFLTLSNERIEQQRAQSQGQPLTSIQEEQIKDEVWAQMLSNILFESWKDKMGVDVSAAEFRDMFTGIMPDPNVKQMFSDPQTGEFNAEEAIMQFNEFEKTTNDTMKRNWAAYKQGLMKNRLQQKIGNLVTAALYMPKTVLDVQAKLKNQQTNVELVQIPYTLVSDDKVTVTDQEIKDYLNTNKARFTVNNPIVEMEVIQIPIVPSIADSMAFIHQMDSLKTLFATAENPEEFASNVTGQTVQAQSFTKDMLASLPNSEELMAAGVGSMVGPFPIQGTQYAVAKIMDKSTLPDSIEVRHILITTQDPSGASIRTKEEAQSLIDSLATALKAGANFDSLAATFSDDPGSKNNGGKYTFTASQKASLTKPFGDFAFSGNAGESKIVFVEQGYVGYHYIEILKRSASSQAVSNMVMMFQNLEVSEQSKQNLNNIANQFVIEASKGGNSFDKEAQKIGVNKVPVMANPNTKIVGNVGVSGDLMQWANKANVGDISPIVIIDNKYVIAKLTGKSEKGQVMESENLKKEIEQILKTKKKADILIQEYDSKGDLANIATASGQTIGAVDSISFLGAKNPMLNSEAKLLGYIISPAGAVGQTSKGIPGRQGVYYVKVLAKNEINNGAERNLDMERKAASSMYRANAYRMFLNSKIQNADIDDKRSEFINKGL